jgi:hypothetical protein
MESESSDSALSPLLFPSSVERVWQAALHVMHAEDHHLVNTRRSPQRPNVETHYSRPMPQPEIGRFR